MNIFAIIQDIDDFIAIQDPGTYKNFLCSCVHMLFIFYAWGGRGTPDTLFKTWPLNQYPVSDWPVL